MDARENQSFPRTPVALTVLTAIVYAAGFAMIAAWLALVLLDQPRASTMVQPLPSPCHVCGVVERVGESRRSGLELSGDAGEGVVVMLAALVGRLDGADAPLRVYETTVRHDDGSVRIVRYTRAPQWRRGDRVKVIAGRVELDPEAAARLPLAAAAPAALLPGGGAREGAGN
jgi:hypothetical protein